VRTHVCVHFRGGYSTIYPKSKVCACVQRTGTAARESLRRGRLGGLTINRVITPNAFPFLFAQLVAGLGSMLAERDSNDVFPRRKQLLRRAAVWFGRFRAALASKLKAAGVPAHAALDTTTHTSAASSEVTPHDKACLTSYMVYIRDLCWHMSKDQFCHPTLQAVVHDDVWSTLPAALLRQLLCSGNEHVR
jgi:hypothetical protein